MAVQGTDDHILDPQNVYLNIQAISAYLKVKWIERGSHAAFYEERDQVVDGILDFLRTANVGFAFTTS
jgi:pimeloyl-ACP methyl ester carboxylesterase